MSKNWGVPGTRKVGIFIYFSQILWGVVLWVTYGRILRKTCQNDFSNQYSFTKGKILIQSNLNDFTFDSHVMSVPKLSILLSVVNYFQSCIRIILKDRLFLPPPLFRFLLTLSQKKGGILMIFLGRNDSDTTLVKILFFTFFVKHCSQDHFFYYFSK